MLQAFQKHRKEEKSGMVLYCAAIPVLLYPLLMHKMGMNPDKKAVLFIDRHEYEERTDIEAVRNFKTQGIFADVVDCSMFLNRNKIESDPESRCIEHFDEVFNASGYKLNDFQEIYVLNDSWDGDINLYFNLKKVEYTWIGCNKDYVPAPFTPSERWRKLITDYKSLTPFAQYAKPCILIDSDQIKTKLNEENKIYSTWDITKIYENLGNSDIRRIGKCFRIDELLDTDESVLVIKNSGAICVGNAFKRWSSSEKYIRLLTNANQYHMDDFTPFFDKIALDFFAPDAQKVYVKEHPNCPINEIQREIYGENIITFTKMPFELLMKYFLSEQIKFKSVIGYLSSALLAMNHSICNDLYILGENFLRTCFFYSSLYASLCYAAHCKFNYIYCSNMLKSQFELLLQTVDFSIELREFVPGKMGEARDALFVMDYVLEGRGIGEGSLRRVHNSSAVCFLNVELTDDFFEDSLIANMAPIEIKKEKISEGFLNLHRDERLWVYAKSPAILKAARFFTMEKILPRCGLRTYVEESTLAAGVELFRECSERCKTLKLWVQLDKLEKVIKKCGSVELLTGMLQEETDVSSYVELLVQLKSRYLILLSVRDTPGNELPADALRAIQELGFTKFSKELWQMYIGVSQRGEVLCDLSGESREAPVSFTCGKPMDISVSSMAWRQGNKAEIIVNGEDYSVNIRGLNFVVLNPETGRLIDSVGFDWHTMRHEVRRRQK